MTTGVRGNWGDDRKFMGTAGCNISLALINPILLAELSSRLVFASLEHHHECFLTEFVTFLSAH